MPVNSYDNHEEIHHQQEKNNQQKQIIFDFAIHLQKQDSSDAMEAGQWLENEILGPSPCNEDTLNKITLILNAELITDEEKITHMLQLKNNVETLVAQDSPDTEQEEDKLTPLKKGAETVASKLLFPALVALFTQFGTACGARLFQTIMGK